RRESRHARRRAAGSSRGPGVRFGERRARPHPPGAGTGHRRRRPGATRGGSAPRRGPHSHRAGDAEPLPARPPLDAGWGLSAGAAEWRGKEPLQEPVPDRGPDRLLEARTDPPEVADAPGAGLARGDGLDLAGATVEGDQRLHPAARRVEVVADVQRPDREAEGAVGLAGGGAQRVEEVVAPPPPRGPLAGDTGREILA